MCALVYRIYNVNFIEQNWTFIIESTYFRTSY